MTNMCLHVPPGTGERYPMPDGDHIVKAVVRDANGGFEVFEIVAPAAPPAPAHSSPWSGVMYLLEGRLTALVGDASYDVEPGGLVFFPDRPIEESISDILSVTQRHGVALAGA